MTSGGYYRLKSLPVSQFISIKAVLLEQLVTSVTSDSLAVDYQNEFSQGTVLWVVSFSNFQIISRRHQIHFKNLNITSLHQILKFRIWIVFLMLHVLSNPICRVFNLDHSIKIWSFRVTLFGAVIDKWRSPSDIAGFSRSWCVLHIEPVAHHLSA